MGATGSRVSLNRAFQADAAMGGVAFRGHDGMVQNASPLARTQLDGRFAAGLGIAAWSGPAAPAEQRPAATSVSPDMVKLRLVRDAVVLKGAAYGTECRREPFIPAVW